MFGGGLARRKKFDTEDSEDGPIFTTQTLTIICVGILIVAFVHGVRWKLIARNKVYERYLQENERLNRNVPFISVPEKCSIGVTAREHPSLQNR